MVLSKKEIISRIKNKQLSFTPELDGFQMQPHSVDLRLGFDFHIPKSWTVTDEGRKALTIDPLMSDIKSMSFDKISLKPGQYFELLPQEYIVATTLEKINLNAPDLMGILFPRSSINRRGLAVDLSGIVDVGYSGYLMIPIVNNTHRQTIRIYPGERICQIIIQTISSEIDNEEALMHGLNQAKYHNNDEGFITGRADKSDEIKLIKQGKISSLKSKYKVKIK